MQILGSGAELCEVSHIFTAHFRRGAGNDVLGEAIEFIRHDAAFDHLDAAAPREFDRGGTSDVGETLLFIRTAD